MSKFMKFMAGIVVLACLGWSATARAATEAEKMAAIQSGLAHLAATQASGGYWNYGGYEEAATGAAASAFLSQKANWGANAAQYQTVVDNAIAYLLANASTMSVSTRNDGVNICPGGAASCTGVYWYGAGESTYTTGLVASAVDLYGVSKGASAVATASGPLAGMTWGDIAQGITNEFAASQSSAINGNRDGGWRYYIPGNGDSDGSTTQWAVISMIYDQTLGAVTPQTVIDHLKVWLGVAQIAGYGGAGCYQPDYAICEESDTGSLLIGLKFTGADLNNAQVQAALGFLNTDWASGANSTWYGNFGQPYAMWAVYKALEVNIGVADNTHIVNRYTDCGASRSALPGSGNCNWWEDYNEWLKGNQNADGSWNGYAYWGDPLSTAFYVSILGATEIPQITAPCLVFNAMVGTAIVPATMQATGGAGGPYTYSATGLPDGLAMSSDGVISGTPTKTGTFSYVVTITDKAGNKGNVTCSIVVVPAITAPCPAISAMQGLAIAPATMAATGGAGGPYTYAAAGLPTGLTMSSAGVISGTPTVSGSFNYTVTITDSAGNVGTVKCSLVVLAAITAPCPAISATMGTAITSATLVATGGAGGPYTYSATGLPTGLTMSSAGVISGTPTVSGSFNYTVTITDKAGNKGTVQCSLTVATSTASVCPHKEDYWEDHPNKWPVSSLKLGSQTYSAAQLLKILRSDERHGRHDPSMILAGELIAAKLNIAHGSDPTPIMSKVNSADALLAGFSGMLPYHVKKFSSMARQMDAVEDVLERYNNGFMTRSCKSCDRDRCDRDCDRDDHGRH